MNLHVLVLEFWVNNALLHLSQFSMIPTFFETKPARYCTMSFSILVSSSNSRSGSMLNCSKTYLNVDSNVGQTSRNNISSTSTLKFAEFIEPDAPRSNRLKMLKYREVN